MTSPHFVCPHCGGSGEIVGFGAKVRAARRRCGASRRDGGEGPKGLTPADSGLTREH